MYNVYMVKNKSVNHTKPFKLMGQFDNFESAKEFAISEGKKRARSLQIGLYIPINDHYSTVMVVDFGSWNETYIGIIRE